MTMHLISIHSVFTFYHSLRCLFVFRFSAKALMCLHFFSLWFNYKTKGICNPCTQGQMFSYNKCLMIVVLSFVSSFHFI